MREFSASPIEMFYCLWRNRSLALTLTKREIVGRYRGSFMGIFWSFFNPLFMLAVYTFVFGEVFNARWSGGTNSKAEFALVLFAGLIVFNIFAECINRAPMIVISNINYVKKVVFPLELLPWVTLCSSLFHSAVSLLVWLGAYVFFLGVPHLTALFFPLVLLPFIFLVLGLSWFLSSLGVYLRDVGQIVGILTTAIMFLSPIFFPITSLPEAIQSFIYLNPLALPIEQVRDVLLWGKEPNWQMSVAYSGIALVIDWFGFAWFQKTRKGFADVL